MTLHTMARTNILIRLVAVALVLGSAAAQESEKISIFQSLAYPDRRR